MKQISFSQAEFNQKKKKTRREQFLQEMERIVPWQRLLDKLAPEYFQDSEGRRGRPPIGLERMLRIYFLQQWYGLADEALEDTLYDSQSLRGFVGIDLTIESVPDATTLCRFRHWLEKNDLTQQIFKGVRETLEERGLFLKEGTIVDATIIAAAPSTKNQSKSRDPEMHQTKKGNAWHFGMKAHIGVDAEHGLVHTVTATAANVSDVTETHNLLHGQEERVFADAGYIGADKREEIQEKVATGALGNIQWSIAEKRNKIKAILHTELRDAAKKVEFAKSQIRAKVEHPFHVIKNLFKHRKVRYRGLQKNLHQLYSLFALANLVLAKKALMEECG